MVNKTGLYARVSTTEQNVQTQLAYLRRYASLNKLNVVGEYTDIGQSGMKDSRPEFDKLLSDTRAGKINTILTYKLDRIGRSVSHLLKLFEEFKKSGVAFHSATQNISTKTPEGRMFLQMLMVLAEYERELLVSRTLSGLERARAEGKRIGRPPGKKDSKPRRKSGYYLRWQNSTK